MQIRTWLLVAPLSLLIAAFAAACDGGGGQSAPPELSSIPTATPPNTLREPIIVGSVTAAPAGGTYVIQSGDLLGEIAARFGITVDALIAANEPLDPTTLEVGRVLIIPEPDDSSVLAATAEPTEPAAPVAQPTAVPPTPIPQPTPADGELIIHIVQAGEFPNTIAPLYGITAEELMAANGITDPTSLQIGQELIIPLPSGG